MSDFKYKGKILTFWELLKDQNIEIPIIQRDYAQGREDKEELRGNFLSALHDSLNDPNPIKLDFIYGSNESGSFQPLDGQQRLTTLFLLHWYAALKSGKLDGDNSKTLQKFSYETRTSSREFCSSLVTNPIIFDYTKEKISDLIIDSSWFFLSWKKDPTIDAMLRSIDDIHKRFCNLDDLWDKLTSPERPISFYHVELKDIGLTDDLYIKMNARGKLLSSFENFKASFQKRLNENEWEKGREFFNTFACKIDTTWTDLFWSHRKENSIDEAFMRFISAVVMVQQAREKKPDRLSIISGIQRNPHSVKVENFSKSTFDYLCECLDVYCKVFNDEVDTNLNFPLWQHNPENGIFATLVYEDNNSSPQRNSASYTQKALFYAQTEYLRRISVFDKEKFLCWMRVVRNIVCRGDIERSGLRPAIIRSPATFDGVINLISELSEGCENIYQFLSSNTIRSSFAKEQIEEERIKAKLIETNPHYKETIFITEDTNLLQGRIDFALYCIEYDSKSNVLDEDYLKKVQSVITTYLGGESDVNSDLRRALLTISDENDRYSYYEYWWSYSNVVEANKRCLIDKFGELEYFIYGNYKNRESSRQYLKKLINKLCNNSLNEIISNFVSPPKMPNWKIRLIQEPKLLAEKCKSNYIAIPNDESCCYLLKSMRPRDLDGCEKIE